MSEQSSSLGILTRELMAMPVPDDLSDVSQFLSQVGMKRTGAAMLLGSMFKKACGGDVSAAKLIREMNGEADSEGGNVDYSQMSDELLRKMAEGEALMAVAEREGQGYRMKDSSGDRGRKGEEKYPDVWDQPKMDKPVTQPKIVF